MTELMRGEYRPSFSSVTELSEIIHKRFTFREELRKYQSKSLEGSHRFTYQFFSLSPTIDRKCQ
jgi:hypothetical protein